MRERVAALGGRLHAGPREEGGFRVRAELPLAGDRVIRVLLADDQALIRAGIRALLDSEDGIEVVGEAADGQQAVALAREHRPDVALMDIQMPVLDGIEATRHIAGDPQLAAVHVVILTNYGLDEYVFGALRAGRQRVPAEGHRTGRPAPGAAGGRARRRAAVARPSPAA